jgi:hypothetical protein
MSLRSNMKRKRSQYRDTEPFEHTFIVGDSDIIREEIVSADYINRFPQNACLCIEVASNDQPDVAIGTMCKIHQVIFGVGQTCPKKQRLGPRSTCKGRTYKTTPNTERRPGPIPKIPDNQLTPQELENRNKVRVANRKSARDYRNRLLQRTKKLENELAKKTDNYHQDLERAIRQVRELGSYIHELEANLTTKLNIKLSESVLNNQNEYSTGNDAVKDVQLGYGGTLGQEDIPTPKNKTELDEIFNSLFELNFGIDEAKMTPSDSTGVAPQFEHDSTNNLSTYYETSIENIAFPNHNEISIPESTTEQKTLDTDFIDDIFVNKVDTSGVPDHESIFDTACDQPNDEPSQQLPVSNLIKQPVKEYGLEKESGRIQGRLNGFNIM